MSSSSAAAAHVIVKATLANSIKKVSTPVPNTFSDLAHTIHSLFKGSEHVSGDPSNLILRYFDEEHDLICMESDADLNLALTSLRPQNAISSTPPTIHLKLIVNDKLCYPVTDDQLPVTGFLNTAFIKSVFDLRSSLNMVVNQISSAGPAESSPLKTPVPSSANDGGSLISSLLSNTHVHNTSAQNLPKPISTTDTTQSANKPPILPAQTPVPASAAPSKHPAPAANYPTAPQTQHPSPAPPQNKQQGYQQQQQPAGRTPQHPGGGYQPQYGFPGQPPQQQQQGQVYPGQNPAPSGGTYPQQQLPNRVSSHLTGSSGPPQPQMAPFQGYPPNAIQPPNAPGAQHPNAPPGYPPSYGYPPNPNVQQQQQQQQQHGYLPNAQQQFGARN